MFSVLKILLFLFTSGVLINSREYNRVKERKRYFSVHPILSTSLKTGTFMRLENYLRETGTCLDTGTVPDFPGQITCLF